MAQSLQEQLDQAYQAYCEYLELYGDADEDTQQLEREYIALERMLEEA